MVDWMILCPIPVSCDGQRCRLLFWPGLQVLDFLLALGGSLCLVRLGASLPLRVLPLRRLSVHFLNYQPPGPFCLLLLGFPFRYCFC